MEQIEIDKLLKDLENTKVIEQQNKIIKCIFEIYKDKNSDEIDPIFEQIKKTTKFKKPALKNIFNDIKGQFKNKNRQNVIVEFLIPNNVPETTIEDVEKVVNNNFPAMWIPVKGCLSTISVLSLEELSDPVDLNLEGAPSSEKTTILSFFYPIDGLTFHTDDFTPKSFVSHANKPEEELKNIDLLPKIKNKCFIVPELAPLFSKQKDELIHNLGILTRILDGDGYESDSGNAGHRGYQGEYLFTWLGGTTPLPTHVWNVMGKLGSRKFFLHIPPKNKSNEELQKLVTGDSAYRTKIDKCRITIRNFLYCQFKKFPLRKTLWESKKDSQQASALIVGAVQKDSYIQNYFLKNNNLSSAFVLSG